MLHIYLIIYSTCFNKVFGLILEVLLTSNSVQAIGTYFFLLSDWLLDRSSEAPPTVVQCILWSRRFYPHKGKIFLKAVQFVQFDQFPPCARAKLRVNAQCSTTANVQNNSSSKFWSEFISQRKETAWNYKRKTKQNIGCTAERCWKNKSLPYLRQAKHIAHYCL